MEPRQCCCVPLPLAFHFNVHVNRLDRLRVSPISTVTHASSRQKSTWKRPIVDHTDITPAFNCSFNVCICTPCHGHGENTNNNWRAVYKYGIWETSSYSIFHFSTSKQKSNGRKIHRQGTIYLTFTHFECVAIKSFSVCSYSNVRICFFIHLKFKIWELDFFFSTNFWHLWKNIAFLPGPYVASKVLGQATFKSNSLHCKVMPLKNKLLRHCIFYWER